MLTPTLAEQYPALAEEHSVEDWRCPVCGQTFARSSIAQNNGVENSPTCPACWQSKQAPVWLRSASSVSPITERGENPLGRVMSTRSSFVPVLLLARISHRRKTILTLSGLLPRSFGTSADGSVTEFGQRSVIFRIMRSSLRT